MAHIIAATARSHMKRCRVRSRARRVRVHSPALDEPRNDVESHALTDAKVQQRIALPIDSVHIREVALGGACVANAGVRNGRETRHIAGESQSQRRLERSS
eukprot:Amastigsp_a181638_3.p3 type:complete len:101 gc:universal Amastigsp_a181638_3:313-11(-)